MGGLVCNTLQYTAIHNYHQSFANDGSTVKHATYHTPSGQLTQTRISICHEISTAHVASWQPCSMHDLGHVSRVGSVLLYKSRAVSHNGRLGSRWSRSASVRRVRHFLCWYWTLALVICALAPLMWTDLLQERCWHRCRLRVSGMDNCYI